MLERGGGGGDEAGATGEGEETTGASTGVVLANGNEPQNPLVPTNTNEVGGGKILDLIFAGLVSYDADGAMHNEVAESIETEDSQNYTITLKDGWTFSDGSPVTANRLRRRLEPGCAAEQRPPLRLLLRADRGLLLEEDSEPHRPGGGRRPHLHRRLKQPEADFPMRLGYSAFYPLPESAFEDLEAFGENPIGNGPYKPSR